MKKITMCLTMVLSASLLMITGCQKEATLSVSPSTVNVEAEAASAKTIATVTCNTKWSATVDASWVTLVAASGDATSTSLTANIAENTETAARTAVVTVKAGDKSSTVTISQSGADPWKGTTITAITGDFKMGVDQTVNGTGWVDTSDQLIACAGTDSVYITNDQITFKSKKIAFGISPAEAIGGKTGGKLILVRGGLRKEIGTGLNFIIPTVEEGWLPEAAFRNHLKKKDATIANMFDKYDMLDVESAGAYTGPSNGEFYLDEYSGTGMEGISLFHKLNASLRAWGDGSLESVDISGCHALQNCYFNSCAKLSSIKFSAEIPTVTVNNDPMLTYVDLKDAKNLVRYNSRESGDNSGKYKYIDARKSSDVHWTGEFYVAFANDATVKILANQFGYDWHDGQKARYGGLSAILDAWKNQNLKIKVYDDADTSKVVYDIPFYSEKPTWFADTFNGFDINGWL